MKSEDHNQFCVNVNASTMSRVIELLYSYTTQPPVLKTNLDTIVDTGVASTSLAICYKIRRFELLTFHHRKISKGAPNQQ